MQFERGAAPLVVLGRDQPMVELLVLAAGGVQRLRERIEAVGDGGKLLRAGSWQPYPIVALLEVGEAAGDAGERIEHPSEQDIENGNDGDVHDQRHRAERDGIAPDLRDLVARLRHDLDRADARPIDHHRHVAACDRRGDQRCKPAWRTLTPRRIGVADRWRHRERGTLGVLHPDAHVPHQP